MVIYYQINVFILKNFMNDKYKILYDTLFPDICVEIHDGIQA